MSMFFDLDGTILDVSRKYHAAHVLAATKAKVRIVSFREYWGAKRKKISEDRIVNILANDRLFKRYERERVRSLEKLELLDLDEPFSGIHGVLGSVKKVHKLYLVTLRRNKKNLHTQLVRLGLLHLFEKILSTAPKGDPSGLKIKLINKVGYLKDDTMIGDTEIDIITAKKLGMRSVGVYSGIRTMKFLKKYHPDVLVKSTVDFFD